MLKMHLCLILMLCLTLRSECFESPRVKVKQGEMEGVELTSFSGSKFLAFRGIPYGTPPVGPLRFKLPKPALPWEGILDATKDGPFCPQLNFFNFSFLGQEDCLFLNVYTPKLPSDDTSTKLPVMLHIHGGGFFGGNGMSNFIGPFRLMDKDVVFVAINYRLGPLGFLNTEDSVASGNYGLWDQRLALQWVQENIHAFGGNPEQVTIFGGSAGGASVAYHLISSPSKGLFHRAIVQSGTALCHWAFQEQPLKAAQRLAEDLHCPVSPTEKLVDCLREKNPEEIFKVTQSYSEVSIFPMLFVPSIERTDGPKFLEDHPMNLFRNGRINNVPVISGITSSEGLFFGLGELQILKTLQGETLRNRLEHGIALIGGIQKKDVTEALEMYMKDTNLYNVDNPEFVATYMEMLSDGSFNAGNEQLVLDLSKHNIPVYMYITEHEQKHSFAKYIYGENVKGVSHGEDVSFVVNMNLTEFMGNNPDLEGNDKIMSEIVKNMWVNFAKFGNPTPETGVDVGVRWNRIAPGEINYLRIRLPLEMKTTLPSDKIRFWNEKVNQRNERIIDEL